MTGFYSYRPEPEIIWVTDLNQLSEQYKYSLFSYKKFVFARYEIVDKTHDKLLKRTASIKKAEEKKEKHLKYKKHANCDVQIMEVDLQSKLDLDLSNVYGTDAVNKKFEMINNHIHKSDFEWKPTNRDVIIVDRNINMEFAITGVDTDKYILTKDNKQMRLTKIAVADRLGNGTSITFFDNNIVDVMGERKFIKVKNAEVNMRKYRDSNELHADGLKIPSWGSMEFISGFSEKNPEIVSVQFVEPVAEEVRCEQPHCSGQGKDRQYYCTKCDMELCSICKFEHQKDTSISGLECDLEICYGSRKDNTEVVAN